MVEISSCLFSYSRWFAIQIKSKVESSLGWKVKISEGLRMVRMESKKEGIEGKAKPNGL